MNGVKRWIKEQATFETFFGALIFLPWGLGFIYYAFYDIPGGYRYAMWSTGVALIVNGVHKMCVNRIKQAIINEKLVEERKASVPEV